MQLRYSSSKNTCTKNTSFKTVCSMFMGASLAEPHAHDLMMWLQDEDYRHQVKCNRSSYSVELGRNRTDLFASFKFVLSSKCRQFFFSCHAKMTAMFWNSSSLYFQGSIDVSGIFDYCLNCKFEFMWIVINENVLIVYFRGILNIP